MSLPNKDLFSKREEPLFSIKQPTLKSLDSQLVSASQLYEKEGKKWIQLLKETGFSPEGCVLDRKVWDIYVLQAITTYVGDLKGKKGLAFGSAFEMMPSYFASKDSQVIVTDFISQKYNWQASEADQLYFKSIINKNDFRKRVSFKNVNMNSIPSDLKDFDYCWSCGSLEHIDSHDNGISFIENARETLAPGGIAVHTTEFTLTSDKVSHDSPDLSFYCKQDIEELAMRLIAKGHKIVLNFKRRDTLVDTPDPKTRNFHYGRTLLAHMNNHVITSMGLIIQKG